MSCVMLLVTSGLDEVYVDHFQGYLAGLSILKDKTESERVIQCLNTCQENLDFTELKDMPSGSVSILVYTVCQQMYYLKVFC